jgi:pyruvate/2-oxoglutarate dehydrogenase complex dihydrolipoamide acyltransferase (E2) component
MRYKVRQKSNPKLELPDLTAEQYEAHSADPQLAGKYTYTPVPDVPLPAEARQVTDAAEDLAEANAIDLATVNGTGKDGRVTVGDVEKLIKK